MSIAVLGEALIDLITQENGVFAPHLGGSPYNVAIASARQGANVSYLSPLSNDHFGDLLQASLLSESVSLPEPKRSNLPTSLAVVKVADSGQATYRLYRQGIADKDITAKKILAMIPDGLKIFHTGSLAITPSQLEKIKTVFAELRKQNILLSIDINIRLGASDDTSAYLNGVRSLVPYCDIVKASDEDIDALNIDSDTLASAEILFSEMPQGVLLLTKGNGGATVFYKHHRINIPGYNVAMVADTVGAGDTFHGSFLASLERFNLLNLDINEWPIETLETSVSYACAAAAINVSRVGCQPPTIKELETYMQSLDR